MFSIGDKVSTKHYGPGTIVGIDRIADRYEIEFSGNYFLNMWLPKDQVSPLNLPMGNSNTTQMSSSGLYGWGGSWDSGFVGDSDPSNKENNNKPKCECGQSKIVKANEIDYPEYHSDWCPIYKEHKK